MAWKGASAFSRAKYAGWRWLAATVGLTALMSGGAIVACKSKAPAMKKLVMEDKGYKMTLDSDGLHFEHGDKTAMIHADGVFVTREDADIGTRSSSLSGGLVSSSCQGSMVQLGADRLGAQVLITDTKDATAQLRAAQGIGQLHLWSGDMRIELTAHPETGSVRIKGGSEATLRVNAHAAGLDLRTGQHEKSVTSADKP